MLDFQKQAELKFEKERILKEAYEKKNTLRDKNSTKIDKANDNADAERKVVNSKAAKECKVINDKLETDLTALELEFNEKRELLKAIAKAEIAEVNKRLDVERKTINDKVAAERKTLRDKLAEEIKAIDDEVEVEIKKLEDQITGLDRKVVGGILGAVSAVMSKGIIKEKK